MLNPVTPATANKSRTDLYGINHVVQNTILSYPKELIIGMLRDEFSKDSYYHYVADQWGFPKVIDHTNLPLEAGLEDDEVTRLFIGESWHFDGIFYPAVLVKAGSVNYTPISINRNKFSVNYDQQLLIDGYGNQKLITIPSSFDLAGVWEGSIIIDVITRDILSRDELISFMMLYFSDIGFEALVKAGVVVKKVSASAPTEGDDRQQEKLYKQSITLDIRSEWRRNIPVGSVIDQINICVDFGDLTGESYNPNLEVRDSITLIDQLYGL